MSAPIPLRDYVGGGLVSAETVNALLAYGEPWMQNFRDVRGYEGDALPFRAFLRKRGVVQAIGKPGSTPQFAATALLEKLRSRIAS